MPTWTWTPEDGQEIWSVSQTSDQQPELNSEGYRNLLQEKVEQLIKMTPDPLTLAQEYLPNLPDNPEVQALAASILANLQLPAGPEQPVKMPKGRKVPLPSLRTWLALAKGSEAA